MKHPVNMTKEEWRQFYPVDDEPETRQCNSSCSHFDLINMCCWVVTGKSGLFTEVSEHDYCHHGFKENSYE